MAESPRYLKVCLLLAIVHMPLTLGHFNVTNQNNTSNKCLETGRYFQNTVIAFWKKKKIEKTILSWLFILKKKKCVNHETLHRIKKPAKCKVIQKRVALVFTTLYCSRIFLSEN